MAATDTYRPKTIGYGNRLAAATQTMIAALSNWNDRRATRKALGSLTDRELDDIGLTRGDVYDIAR